jgi:hypothetical protein
MIGAHLPYMIGLAVDESDLDHPNECRCDDCVANLDIGDV